ncbi:MAG: ABC transporter substrate-binding protein [Planctomycetota bacterium]|nr:MAG: ABC transporter substrate-binding protein [Planctomycetota bacterium]
MLALPGLPSRAFILLTAWLFAAAATLTAQEEPKPLVIGTKQAAPFSFQVGDGPWQGISIDLWRGIAEKLGRPFEFRELPLDQLISGLQDGTLDASVAALTVTPEREQVVDFSHPFHPSGLGIAVSAEEGGGILAAVQSLLSFRFFQAVGTLVVVIFLGGFVLWLLERKKNPEQFGGSTSEGLGAAFWWSAVTMTTVGYGDKAPTTGAGRFVAVIWMFASIILISGLTAAIASTLTISQLESSISGPQDLAGLGRIACVRSSTSEDYLQRERLSYTALESLDQALDGLADGQYRAVVYDAPILRYMASTDYQDQIDVLPFLFERQDYAIAMPLDSELRKPVNRLLLEAVGDPAWEDTLYKYMGSSE